MADYARPSTAERNTTPAPRPPLYHRPGGDAVNRIPRCWYDVYCAVAPKSRRPAYASTAEGVGAGKEMRCEAAAAAAARFFGGHGARKLHGRGGDDDASRGNGGEEGRRRAKQLIRRRPDGGDVFPTTHSRQGLSPDFLRADRRRMPPPPPCPFIVRPTSGKESTWTPLLFYTKIIFARHACAVVLVVARVRSALQGDSTAVVWGECTRHIPRNSGARLHLK